MEKDSLILASASPRRSELLARVGVEFEVIPADVDESVFDGAAENVVRALARAKAEAVARTHTGRWVLGADTVVSVGGRVLGKPTGADEARRMLEMVEGGTHQVTTGFCLCGPATIEGAVVTHVTMRAFYKGELDDYVAAGEWRGKAGAYAVQGMAAGLVTSIEGSITNVIGLPLAEVLAVLKDAGVARAHYVAGRPA